MLSNSTSTLLSVAITIATLCGVALHESKLDKLAMATIGYSALATSHEIGSLKNDAHTHVDRISVQSTLNNRVPANRLRYTEVKQHMLQQNVPRGHHAFDNYLLPVVA